MSETSGAEAGDTWDGASVGGQSVTKQGSSGDKETSVTNQGFLGDRETKTEVKMGH